MEQLRTAASARRAMVASIIALTVASVSYRLLVTNELQHSSLVFIGIPAVLALALLAVRPTTSVGSVQKTIAIALCLSGILFGEGFVCILMASPLFFLVGAMVGKFVGRNAERPDGRRGADWRFGTLLLLLPMSLEGVLPSFELPREEVVTVSRMVDASGTGVREALGEPMRFEHALPLFFRLGFPTPGQTAGAGLAVGDRRSIAFEHGGHHPGTLVLEITATDAGRIHFAAVADDSYLTHWLAWRSAEVTWTELSPNRTEVTWTLRYRRRLDPAWYFKPLERYGVSLAAGYLIETLATPRGK